MQIDKTYMGFEDAHDYFAQAGDKAKLALNMLLAEGRQFVDSGRDYVVDGWLRLYRINADMLLISSADWHELIVDGAGATSEQWQALQALMAAAPLDETVPFNAGSAPMSARKQAIVAAFADDACDRISFVPLTSFAASEMCRRHHNGIEKGNEATWSGDLVSRQVGGKWYVARCLEY